MVVCICEKAISFPQPFHNYMNNLKESFHFRFGIVGSGIRSELIKSKKAYKIKQIWVYNSNLKVLFRYNAKQHWANWTRPVENWVCELLVGLFHGKFETSGI